MTYRSVCTGIAAETVAWHSLGWRALSFSEIDPFCNRLLSVRYPEVPNCGDFTKIKEQAIRADILMGGTPCQSFSVAGKRAGLDDPRGNLALEFARLAERLRPRWIIWENVKGVLSQDEGRAFGTFLWALEECGYGFAYRVLDAQFDGLAQRRQRVFVVGYLGDWRPPAAVLFERESLRRDLAPRRETGQEVAGTIGGHTHKGGCRPDGLDSHGAYIPILEAGASTGREGHEGRDGLGIGSDGDPMYTLQAGKQHAVAMALNAHGGAGRMDGESETFVVAPLTSANHYGDQESRESQLVVAHTLSADGFDASEDGTGRGSPLVVETLRSHPRPGSNTVGALATITGTLSGANGGGMPDPSRLNAYARIDAAVRRLTPKEWERLMGFDDDYTLIPYPRKKLAADGPRYKAIGNSISVPTLRWIGRRIQTVDDILSAKNRTE